MDETEYLKSACKECGTNIEYPMHAAGATVTCPNCGQWTELPKPETPAEQKGLTINLAWVVLVACAALAAGAFWWHQRQPAATEKEPAVLAVKIAPPPATNPPALVAAPVVQAAPAKPRPKSHDDLKVGEIQLEKTPDTTLVYAVGTVTNDSDWQRFGVKIELNLFNAQEKKIGTTQDYKDILEPHQTWEFRALIPKKKTASAKFAALTEQE